MRSFRPALRPLAPTAFLYRIACTSVEVAGREKPRQLRYCCHHTWRRALRLILWLRSRRQCSTPCPLRLHIVTALGPP